MSTLPKEINESEPISIPQVRELLIQRAKDGDELSYMQRIALEHAQLTSRISATAAENLVSELVEKFRISNKGAITLANFIPSTVDEIKQLLGKEATFETDTFDEILQVLLSVDYLDESEREIDIDALDEESDLETEEKDLDESMIPEDLR